MELITILFMLSAFSTLGFIISFGVLVWFKKPILDKFKLKYLMKFGYIIAELVRYDKTRQKIVVIPNKETRSVKFPGVEGIYTIDDASVTLTERRWPTYTWVEGETAPMNFDKETDNVDVVCPSCNKEINIKYDRPKSIAPGVLDNIVMKIKTLGQMKKLDQLFLYILLGLGVCILIGGANLFFIDDIKKRAGEIFGQTIYDQCSRAVTERIGAIVTP